MVVIHHGTKKNIDPFPILKKCEHCKCTFLYDKKDIKTEYNVYLNYHTHSINCPECEAKHEIDPYTPY